MLPDKQEPIHTLVSSEREPYPHHVGEMVEINMAGGAHFIGMYRGLNRNDDLVLQPCIAQRNIRGESRDRPVRTVPVWSQRPAFLCYRAFSGISPVEKEDVDRSIVLYAEYANRDMPSDYSI